MTALNTKLLLIIIATLAGLAGAFEYWQKSAVGQGAAKTPPPVIIQQTIIQPAQGGPDWAEVDARTKAATKALSEGIKVPKSTSKFAHQIP